MSEEVIELVNSAQKYDNLTNYVVILFLVVFVLTIANYFILKKLIRKFKWRRI